MLTTFCWVPKGAMKPTPILSTDTAEQARLKLRHQHPEYIEEEEQQQRDAKKVRASSEEAEGEDDDDEDGLNANVDDTLRAFAGGGPGALLEEVESDDEEELEDRTLKPTDLIFTVACADAQAPRLEMYVYDEPEDNMYVHHDMEIAAFPLCSSWLTDGTMSMLAVGTMLPFIEIWALDVMDSVEPAIILGGCERSSNNYSKKMLKRNLKADSHTDAVLSVKWNTVAQNIFASGSADHTIKLWDLNQGGICLGTYNEPEKVQSLDWHATEANLLLSGGFDACMVLRDCRQPDQTAQRYRLPGVIEHVEFVPSACATASSAPVVMASTSDGHWAAFDTRTASSNAGNNSSSPLWRLQPHQADMTFSCSRQVPGLFATGGKEGEIALWDGRDSSAAPKMVVSRSYKTGSVLSLSFHPNSPHILGAGGASGAPLVYTITSDIYDVFR
ncbi:WD domain, G-beta repeat, putative [Leishmania tarentolae]|uniref:WD domain, G-beta repeat, putative n=1 Tax=Leishmania tarentolae TaxID=5689 RepID=A0A640KH00_LEITA|nr:WD domain, G-beta repeat, putative [Leishmania tarentolae]